MLATAKKKKAWLENKEWRIPFVIGVQVWIDLNMQT